jgi:hypothetical protein
MNKISCTIYLIAILVVGLNQQSGFNLISAQMNMTNVTDSTSEVNSLFTSRNGTFSAVGSISSLNFYNNSLSNIAAAEKVILSGDWSINVNDGNVSFFEADFVAAPADGGVSHTHELVNLVVKGKPIQLTSNGSTSILGRVDVKLNGINYWNEVNTTIFLSKGSTITIVLNDVDTEHHFMRQPIYGIVDRLMY